MIALTALVFVLTGTKTGTFADKDLFQIEGLDKINQVVLESPKGKTILSYNGAKWVVNGKYPADRQMITVLFATLKQTVAKRKVAAHLQDSLQKEIIKSGVKISCTEAGVPAGELWAGGNSQKTETYFQKKDGTPYLVTIPGYRVYVASIFELAANDWRDKTVFTFNWQNIKGLEVNFPTDPKQDFKASFNQKLFSIEGISTDTTRLDGFMDALFQLHADRILDSTEAIKFAGDLTQKPMMEIAIQDIGSRSYPLAIFPPRKGSSYVVGKINDEIVFLNPMALSGILRKKEFFIQH